MSSTITPTYSSTNEHESLVQSGSGSLWYALCGCLPCFHQKNVDEDDCSIGSYPPTSSRRQTACDGQTMDGSDLNGSNNNRQQNGFGSMPRFIEDDPPEPPSPNRLGRIQFSIAYDMQQTTLNLKIIRATDLAAKDAGGTSDPYAKVVLLPDKNTKLCTKRKRKNLNPKWNEVFAFEGYPYEKIATSTLLITVLDWDRFSKDDPIGEVCIPMTDMDLLGGQTLWKNLQPSKGATGKLGQLYLTLCYDSSTGEIKVTIVKAMHLKAKDLNGLSDPYVKVWLMLDGRRIEKKKTTVKERNLNPMFEETLTFNVPLDRIRSTALEICVMDFDRCGRNDAIGKILLGTKSGPTEVKHWTEMFARSRQEVSQWHVLKNLAS